jgi:hypothetical protein
MLPRRLPYWPCAGAGALPREPGHPLEIAVASIYDDARGRSFYDEGATLPVSVAERPWRWAAGGGGAVVVMVAAWLLHRRRRVRG